MKNKTEQIMSASKILDYVNVPTISAITISISFTDIEQALRITISCLTIGYIIWKWRANYKRNQKDESHTKSN